MSSCYPPGTPGATLVEVLAACNACGEASTQAAEQELGRLFLNDDRCPECGSTDLEIER